MQKNGQRTAPNHPKSWTIAGFGTAHAVPGFGSQSVAMTAVDVDCVHESLLLIFPKILDQLRSHGQSVEPVTLDKLDSIRLVEKILADRAAIWKRSADFSDTEGLLKFIQAATENQPTESVSQLRALVADLTDKAVTATLSRIYQLANSPPDQLQTIGSQLLKSLAKSKPETHSSAVSVQNAAQVLQRSKEVCQRERSFAASDQQPIFGQLHEAARNCAQAAFRDLVQELVTHASRRGWSELTTAAEGLSQLAAESIARLDEIRRESKRCEQVHQESSRLARSSTEVVLVATEPDEAIAGVLARLNIPSRVELARHLADRLITDLRQHLTGRVAFNPQNAGTFQVLTALPSAIIVERFRQIFTDIIQPECLRVYGRIRRYGVAELLQQLLDRSLLTSDAGPRSSTRFGLNAYRVVILSLPDVVDPEDRAVEQELIRRLQRSQEVQISRHPASFDEIVVHRIGGGWPWQILPSNRHLMGHFVESATIGHHPLRALVFPDAPNGEVLPRYCNLVHEENQNEQT